MNLSRVHTSSSVDSAPSEFIRCTLNAAEVATLSELNMSGVEQTEQGNVKLSVNKEQVPNTGVELSWS